MLDHAESNVRVAALEALSQLATAADILTAVTKANEAGEAGEFYQLGLASMEAVTSPGDTASGRASVSGRPTVVQ